MIWDLPANSLAGSISWRTAEWECTVNGIGERAGNALEEVVIAIKTRRFI